MTTSTVTVETTSGPMGVFVAEPRGPADRAVVVIQEAFGVNDHIEDVTRRFADAGFLAVAPHLFHRTGDPVMGYGDMEVVRPHMAALTEAGILEDLDGALEVVAERSVPPARVAMVGFCMGGTVALLAAARRPIGAGVTFYGGGVTAGRFGMAPLVDLAPGIGAPWLGLYGDEDGGIPTDQVEALRAAAAAAPVPTEVVRYPEAGHGFHCDARAAYHEPSARDAWGRTLAWLDLHIPA